MHAQNFSNASAEIKLKIGAFGISRDSSGKLNRNTFQIKYQIFNSGTQPVSFLFEQSLTYFWEYSVNRQAFKRVGQPHPNPSSPSNIYTLKPGEAIKSSINGIYFADNIKTISLRYNRGADFTIVSNELDISPETIGAETFLFDDDYISDKITLNGYFENGKIAAEIKNISKDVVSFHFDNCGICFWSISVNNSKIEPLTRAKHEAPCEHKNYVTLAPGETISRKSVEFQVKSENDRFKIKYRYGEFEEPHLTVESSEFQK